MAALASASITVSVSDVKPLPIASPEDAVASPEDLFRESAPDEFSDRFYNATPKIIASSYDESDIDFTGGAIFPSSGSVVRAAIEAWTQHQHLILRPDEIWFEMLTQLNYYMTRHAESLRDKFVAHKGKQEISASGLTWTNIVAQLGEELDRRVKTDWLLEWISPGFSTTTESDETTAKVLMMGLMKQYFEFSARIICGIPKVTLLGERGDWVMLLEKLEKMSEFGEQPRRYARNLRPILKMFVRTWDEPEHEEIKEFWEGIVSMNKAWACGMDDVETKVSGWIMGFMHWRKDGTLRYDPSGYYDPDDDDDEEEQEKETKNVISDETLTVKDVHYAPESIGDLPVGYAKAPLKLIDYPLPGETTLTYILAGNIGVERKQVEDGGNEVRAKPLSGWVMYGPVDWNVEINTDGGSEKEHERLMAGFDIGRRVGERVRMSCRLCRLVSMVFVRRG